MAHTAVGTTFHAIPPRDLKAENDKADGRASLPRAAPAAVACPWTLSRDPPRGRANPPVPQPDGATARLCHHAAESLRIDRAAAGEGAEVRTRRHDYLVGDRDAPPERFVADVADAHAAAVLLDRRICFDPANSFVSVAFVLLPQFDLAQDADRRAVTGSHNYRARTGRYRDVCRPTHRKDALKGAFRGPASARRTDRNSCARGTSANECKGRPAAEPAAGIIPFREALLVE